MDLNFFIIGKDTLAIACAETLQYYNHKVNGIVSKNVSVINWANKNDIDILDSLFVLEKEISSYISCYIIVLDNSLIANTTLLSNIKKHAIILRNSMVECNSNYATAYSILKNEDSHLISWTLASKKSDTATIINEHKIELDKYETTFTLNLKIYDAAISLFHQLVKELAQNKTIKIKRKQKLIKQDNNYDLESITGLIDWRKPAAIIDRSHRALQFGTQANKIGCTSFFIKTNIFIPGEVHITTISSKYSPGCLTKTTSSYLQVKCGDNEIKLYKIMDITGRTYTTNELVNLFRLIPGEQLSPINASMIKKIHSIEKTIRRHEKFWIHYLQETSPLSILPSHIPYKKQRLNHDDEITDVIPIPVTIAQQLKTAFTDYSIEIIFFAALLIYFYRMNNRASFAVHTKGLNNINHKNYGDFFASYIPSICDLTDCTCFSDVLKNINSHSQILKRHKIFRQDIFLRYPELEKRTIPLIPYIDILSNEGKTFENSRTKQWRIIITANNLSITYPKSLAKDIRNKTVLTNIRQHLNNLIKDLAQHQNKSIYELSFLDKHETLQIVDRWNNTKKRYSKDILLHQLFESQATKTPNETAVIFENCSLTYSELNIAANKLAHYLISIGITKNSFVALILKRSLNMIISILATLKMGCAYIPVTPEYPNERIKHMLQINCPTIILDHKNDKNRLKKISHKGQTVCLDCDNKKINNTCDTNPKIKNSPQDLAYVLFTSGTTGTPKGVQISHKSLVNHMLWMQEKFAFSDRDIILQKTPFTFDASVWELFIPILSGGKLVFAPNYAHMSPLHLLNLVKKYNVTTLQLVPSLLRELLKQKELKDCTSLKHIFSGGELLTSEIKQQFFNVGINASLHNLYGPTEATIEVTSHTCLNTEEDIRLNIIGKPIYNTQLYILDNDLNLLPTCIVGELHIAGDSLSIGYIGNNELTKQKFIPNKFSSLANAKLYKTGDLARRLPNGCIEILGRIDTQVKIRGFRIELSEIENNILQYPMINQCVVVTKKDKMGFDILVAYIETKEKHHINSLELRHFLKNKLPEYMIPSMFIMLEKIPLNSHGKINKSALPKPNIKLIQKKEKHVKPSNDTETQLIKIWENILNIDGIGIKDDFFSLGGHSLSALQALSRIKNNFGIDLSIKNFIDNPTIYKIVKFVDNVSANSNKKIKGITTYTKKQGHVVALRSSGNKNPLFLIHPIGGTIFWYIQLSHLLEAERPIYAIQDPDISQKKITLTSIEDMASYYLDSIRNIQPNGPYLIGGASFGSTVSVEISKQMHATTDDIVFMPLFDGWAFYPNTLYNPEIFKATMDRQFISLVDKFKSINLIAKASELLKLQQHRLNMLWNYEPSKVSNTLTLFKAQQLMPVFEDIDPSPCNHWDHYSILPVKVYNTPGNHETMFQEPNVQVLATQMNECLRLLL